MTLEKAKREKVRSSLIAFTEYTKDDFETATHHKLIAEKLEAVERGDIKRLIIMAPPRHTKSELASRRFPAWYLGRNPKKQIITSTYSGEFAADFGREVRDIVGSDEYKKIFKIELKEDSQAASRWHTKQGGVYVSVGVGGPITGRGAHLALIDDPIKNRQDADSEIVRDSVWRWYSSTLRTRLMPGGAIVLVLTRWHEDDLAGRLLDKATKGGERWDVVSLPAITDGKALWPEWYDIDALSAIRGTIDSRDWTALYQQSPVADEGDYFKREWFKRYRLGEQPSTRKYISTDFAVTKSGGDFTEFGVIGLDAADDLYIEDWWYGQDDSLSWVESLLDLCVEYKPLTCYGEKGVIKSAMEPILNKRMSERKNYVNFEWIARNKDKQAMAQAFRARASMGKVYIPFTEWGERLINQLCAFPTGKHDDAVDVCALIGLAIDEAIGIKPQSKQDNVVRDRWDRAFDDNDTEDTWRTA